MKDPRSERHASGEQPPSRIAVLLVEDDPEDRARIRALLGHSAALEFSIDEAGTLAEALARLDAASFDLVILDLSLPDADGLVAVARLLEGRPDPPPVIVATGPGDSLEPIEAIRAGAQDCLAKDDAETRLALRTVQTALERHRMGRALEHAREREQYLATHDPLTDLPNRYLFRDRLDQGLAAAHRNGKTLALVVLDVDRFRTLNESLGHDAADRILQEVARRLRRCVRATDTAAHLAADEFALVLTAVAHETDAAVVARTVARALGQPLPILGRELVLTASMGIAVYPGDAREAEELLRNAEAALRSARAERSGVVRFYKPEMNARALARLALENDLHGAIERDELDLHYQAQVDGATGELVGAEALLRWSHPSLGRVSPADFVPFAEETGLIRRIGAWALHRACEDNARWQREGLRAIPVAVNVSSRQFDGADLAAQCRAIVRDTGLDPRSLHLEITESCLVEDPVTVAATLKEIQAQQIAISLDDFGTGYSSLQVLKHLPIDTLKIDQSFVRECTRDPNDAMIAAAIVGLARSLGLGIVGEGVEEPDQREFLLERGCPVMQGYLFSRPLTREDFRPLLARGRIDFEKPTPSP